jgi:hypothetical protein
MEQKLNLHEYKALRELLSLKNDLTFRILYKLGIRDLLLQWAGYLVFKGEIENAYCSLVVISTERLRGTRENGINDSWGNVL